MAKPNRSYQLVDAGNGRKLERFADVLISRPCAQAVWRPSRPQSVWDQADASFTREQQSGWSFRRKIPSEWTCEVGGVLFTVRPTDFGHLGVFPEHAFGWRLPMFLFPDIPWTLDTLRTLGNPNYPAILWRTIRLSMLATGGCILLATPMAYYMARAGAAWRRWLLVRRSPDDPEEVAYYIAAGPARTTLTRLAKTAGADLVLLDTAGRSQRDGARIEEMRALYLAFQPDAVHLVLAANMKYRDMLDVVKRMGVVPISRVIFTKTDETTTYGALLNILLDFDRPVSFITTGQNVPNDIEVASGMRLAEMLLGEERETGGV